MCLRDGLEASKEKTIPCIYWEIDHNYSVVQLAAFHCIKYIIRTLNIYKICTVPTFTGQYAVKIITNVGNEKLSKKKVDFELHPKLLVCFVLFSMVS